MNTRTIWGVGFGAATIAAGLAVANTASATSSESLCYRSSTATICFQWNGPAEFMCRSIFGQANQWMPTFLGIEKEARRRGRHFLVRAGHYPQEVSVDGRPLELPARLGWPDLAQVVAEAIGCDVVARDAVPVFSIQLELLPRGVDAAARVRHWRKELRPILFQLALDLGELEGDLGLLSHYGDCDAAPIWLHNVPDEGTAVRYGVFPTFSSAWHGIATLGVQHADPQIVRTTLRTDSLNLYFTP
ncbi:MAG: hypothetical protein ACRDGR_10810 [bacterium]